MWMIPERLDYLWFLGYQIDDEVPDHSVLSKARARWGRDVFESFFLRVVALCVAVGLVEGRTIHLDGSLIEANASTDSVLKAGPELIAHLKRIYGAQEAKLTEKVVDQAYERSNRRLVSRSDPDAPVVRKGKGGPRPRYKNHRAVDNAHGVITALGTTPGDVEANAKLLDLVEQLQANTGIGGRLAVRDDGELPRVPETGHSFPHGGPADPAPEEATQPGNLWRGGLRLRSADRYLPVSGRSRACSATNTRRSDTASNIWETDKPAATARSAARAPVRRQCARSSVMKIRRRSIWPESCPTAGKPDETGGDVGF